MTARVTIGVPIYRGERFLGETLRSIQTQTFEDYQVVMSIDGPDVTCEAICKQFEDDGRFKMVVQSERLGWVGNLNWLLSQVESEFWYFHQQDDLTHPIYLEVLVDRIDKLPSAALVYCDIAPMGRVTAAFEPEPSVLGGTAFIRQMTMLHQHLVAFPFRGLTRSAAVKQAGPVPVNKVDNYGVDIVWLAGIARWGELHRIPFELYRKRYHEHNTESKWWAWSREKRLEAWAHHCVDMLNQALHLEGSVPEMRLLWLAAIERLTSANTARTFVDLSDLSTEEYATLLTSFLALAATSQVHDIPRLLDADWSLIRKWTEEMYWVPGESTVEIIGFGPNPIQVGHPFNVQPDGTSAIWLRTSKAVPPDTRVRWGDADLKTVIRGCLATATVPHDMFANSGEISLTLIGRKDRQRSNAVKLRVAAAQNELSGNLDQGFVLHSPSMRNGAP